MVLKSIKKSSGEAFGVTFGLTIFVVPKASLCWYAIGTILWLVLTTLLVATINPFVFFIVYFLLTSILFTIGIYHDEQRGEKIEKQYNGGRTIR